MPHVQIWIYRGRTEEQRQALLDGVQAAITSALGIPGGNVFGALQEIDPGCLRRPAWASEHFVLIEIAIFPGRDIEIKKRLYRAIADNLARSPGVSGKDLVIMLREAPGEDWSVRDGLPARETGVPTIKNRTEK